MDTFNIAVVGSGPAGMYLVEALLRLIPVPLAIDVIDRLPTPFGLIRSGVAPDHGSVRAVTQRFEQALAKPGVRYVGGIEVGRDISLEQLRELYDVVVLANGCPLDKALGIPGEDLPGVFGSARFTGWYNAHPDHVDLDIGQLPDTVVVIGNGNVAIDVARLLTKPADSLSRTDISYTALDLLQRSRVRKVVLSGRRGPADARFSVKELEELGEIANVSLALPDGVGLPTDEQIAALPAAQSSMLKTLAHYACRGSSGKPSDIQLQFFARPAAILGRARVEAMRFERMQIDATGVHGSGVFFDLPCGAVVSCIGYRARSLETLGLDDRSGCLLNEDARIDTALYCTGWARRGPSGTIATNRSDASQVAQRIAREVQPGGKAGAAGLDALLAHHSLRSTSFTDWSAIDNAERARATGGAPRRKFHRIAEMLELLGSPAATAETI